MNFDAENKRLNTNSIKWDGMKDFFGKDDVLPMWVADMDFRSPEEISEVHRKITEHNTYGYTHKDDNYYNAVIEWYKKRFNITVLPEQIAYSPGIVPGLKICVNAFSEENDHAVIQSPVYYPFADVLKRNNRIIEDNKLIYKDGLYSVDFEDLEEKIKKSSFIILCNPHNPVGRVWKKEELDKIVEICEKYSKIIISDEIHSDLVYEKGTFYSLLNYDYDKIAVACAPSKTFNLAGLGVANFIFKNQELKNLFTESQERYSVGIINIFGMKALETVYTKCEYWLEELLPYIEKNYNYIKKEFSEKLPGVIVSPLEGTYLLWLNFNKYGNEEKIYNLLLEKGKIGLERGSMFGTTGEGFFRMNIATTHENIKYACNQIIETLK
ncbi:MAG: pyridoxal phosphate-dependent aminotransferase [Thermotogae bacterium]|nr:pyridoxal phosphate-dependent aminotransferase [Thermotogota bacterium]